MPEETLSNEILLGEPKKKCTFCKGTGMDPLASGFVKKDCRECGGKGYLEE